MPASRIECPSGQVVFHEGDLPTWAYLIEAGEVEIVTHIDGESVELGRLGPGDLFGEMAVIDEAARTATVRAVSDCILLPVAREQLQERIDNADPVVRALLRGQLQRYRSALATLRRGSTPPDGRSMSAMIADLHDDGGAIDKMRLESQLRDALNNRALEVRFQPIYEIAESRVAGYEALIRWQHPERGPVSPAEFIRIAEETSLIVPVGRYVFEEVVTALARLQTRGVAPLPFVAVNVSARQLVVEDLLGELQTIAAARRVPPEAVKIEITESLSLDVERVATLIASCHAIGVKVALDDFGTGYSNLGHLHKLNFDTIKLDQSFVRQMLHAPRCLAIVQAIVTMVSALGADMVAEGVETSEQLMALRDMGCRYAQGYLIGKACSLEDLVAAETAV